MTNPKEMTEDHPQKEEKTLGEEQVMDQGPQKKKNNRLSLMKKYKMMVGQLYCARHDA